MDGSEFRSMAKWQISVPPRYSENRIQYLLKAEQQSLCWSEMSVFHSGNLPTLASGSARARMRQASV
jgi:hypothetical protein